MAEKVVKIDSELLDKVEEFINKKENRLIYANKKQFVDIAVLEKLKKEGKNA
jgi:hypothetical protein